jgi:hypothetical protein
LFSIYFFVTGGKKIEPYLEPGVATLALGGDFQWLQTNIGIKTSTNILMGGLLYKWRAICFGHFSLERGLR